MSNLSNNIAGLYDPSLEKSSCGVGFLTRKDGKQTHELLVKGHEALCAVPHRGGMSSEGVGDGAGISVDLSVTFFSRLTGKSLQEGEFGVGNFFMCDDKSKHEEAESVIEAALSDAGMPVILKRDVTVDNSVINAASRTLQLPIRQWIFDAPEGVAGKAFERKIYDVLLTIEEQAYLRPELAGLYPLSLSSRTQVFKGRLNSHELVPYFADLSEHDHEVRMLYFHTRFSTNTDPHPTMAQPFRLMAHNGELNTDKKNRLSEIAVARAKNRSIVRPKGQSDSCRLDQTLHGRVIEDEFDLVTAVVSMMPPAWENDETISEPVRAMLEFFSLYEEKNDGPAALIFGDGNIVGARLDRLGLRPLRSIETDDYIAVMSEAGQISFAEETVISRGRIEAGGMLYFDHSKGEAFTTVQALEMLASERDYETLLEQARVRLDELPQPTIDPVMAAKRYDGDMETAARYVAYTHNQESFRFLMDPMLQSGSEKVSAMGYGNAINALSDNEGGVAKYFSQRFAQVTNPPLDSIREADGMSLRVAIGAKPYKGPTNAKQIVLDTPILRMSDMLKIRAQAETPVAEFASLYSPDLENAGRNEQALIEAIDKLANDVVAFARDGGGIAIISDRHVSTARAAMPMTIVVSAINQRLIEEGLRLTTSLIVESGQISSSHHIACALGFGASAVYALGVRMRAEQNFADNPTQAYKKFAKAAEKALMKTMGKVGLCTVESYSGGEFFEPNFLDTSDHVLKRYFPNMVSPVGGVGFSVIAKSVADWHRRALEVKSEGDIPILGLFKERSEGAGHSYGTTAVRGFVDLTEEAIQFADTEHDGDDAEQKRLLTLNKMRDAFGIDEKGYVNTSFDELSEDAINRFKITPGYRDFSRMMSEERAKRPAALRDVLAFPADITFLTDVEDIKREMMLFNRAGNNHFVIRGLICTQIEYGKFEVELTGPKADQIARLDALSQSLVERFKKDITAHWIEAGKLHIDATGRALDYLTRIKPAPDAIEIDDVQPASEITPCLTSGAMSHGALVATAHEAVAHGTNMVGGLSNSGEGGEHISRYGTIRASRIKQFASGRFGVWAGYLADPNLRELEIKIGQGAKPGEGGQLPAPKVNVEIAAARGGTPGVELVSPPPHHDTYSIEDLAQLIHDCKAARVRVIVKLVSSEGIGTIAVGVAKAGADVINVAGNTGGTGAASVTSLKYTGRAAEIGIAEVHQALSVNGIRQKVVLRCSGAHQTGSDVVKSAMLGGDSFEFGTTALMMLKCVMAKNCNIKCPAGLTTNSEVFDGDPRALGQYLLNIAHEVREILASLGMKSLRDVRGRSNLLHLLDHPASVGQLNLRAMLTVVPERKVDNPIYVARDFAVDDSLLEKVQAALFDGGQESIVIEGEDFLQLNNRNKTVGGQLAVDMERALNHSDAQTPAAYADARGRRFLKPGAIIVRTTGSAGQSFGAFCNDGITLEHMGTCNDGVGKGACGGEIIVKDPKGSSNKASGPNVLIGNFALFGATGGRTFVQGQAGDRFAVRNSGATAVVEGVGDFACEYMTNGTVLNLGHFDMGFGNGMSGGFAYQYDPEGRLQSMMSKDSVLSGSLAGNDEIAEVHALAVLKLLEWHVEATGSKRAEEILFNYANEREKFAWIMPRALLQYQDADEILAAKSRKELAEELATALAAHQVNKVKKAWRDGEIVVGGAVPIFGEAASEEMYRLLNSWTVVNAANELALKRVKEATNVQDPRVVKAARNLVLTEDFYLMNQLLKHARTAVAEYSEKELAVMVSDKRLSDFKQALSLRNILSMDSPGTYGWIMHQDVKNIEAIGHIPSFEELFSKHAMTELAPAA